MGTLSRVGGWTDNLVTGPAFKAYETGITKIDSVWYGNPGDVMLLANPVFRRCWYGTKLNKYYWISVALFNKMPRAVELRTPGSLPNHYPVSRALVLYSRDNPATMVQRLTMIAGVTVKECSNYSLGDDDLMGEASRSMAIGTLSRLSEFLYL